PVLGLVWRFGGQAAGGTSAQLWAWDGAAWTLVPHAGPSARTGSGVVYDRSRATAVLFGGATTGNAASGETWRLVNSGAPAISQQPASISRQVGQTAEFSVAATGEGALVYSWRRGADVLVDGARVSGAASATL